MSQTDGLSLQVGHYLLQFDIPAIACLVNWLDSRPSDSIFCITPTLGVLNTPYITFFVIFQPSFTHSVLSRAKCWANFSASVGDDMIFYQPTASLSSNHLQQNTLKVYLTTILTAIVLRHTNMCVTHQQPDYSLAPPGSD